MSDKTIVKQRSKCPMALIHRLFPLLDMNLAGPFLMILPRPIVPEMTEVMNENQKVPEVVSMPESLLDIMSKTNVKCN